MWYVFECKNDKGILCVDYTKNEERLDRCFEVKVELRLQCKVKRELNLQNYAESQECLF